MAVSRSTRKVGNRHAIWAFLSYFSVGMWSGGADAFDAVWTGGAPTGPSGVFALPANWNASNPPASGDNALFSLAGDYTVQFASSPMVVDTVVSNGNVTFTQDPADNHLYTLTGNWEQVSGSSKIDGLDLEIYKAIRVQGDAEFAVQGSSALTVFGGINVAFETPGDASMNFSGIDGARLEVSGQISAGDLAGSIGSMRIEEGAIVNVDGVMSAGAKGSGIIEVLSGSQVKINSALLVAAMTGSGSGELTVAGSGTLIDVLADGEVALGTTNRSAFVKVLDGATFSTGLALTQLHTSSSLLIDGGTVEVQGELEGRGTINLQNHAVATVGGVADIDGMTMISSGSEFTTLGVMNASTKTGLFGQIAISGADSKLTVGTTLDLQHAASLDVTSGAAVTAQTLQLASMAGAVDVDVVGQGAKISAATVVAGGRVNGGGFTQGGTAQVVIGTGGIFEYTNQLKIFAGSSVRLEGGELRAPNFGALSDPGLVFDAGTYTVMGDATINNSVVANLPGGVLQFGRGIQVEGLATINAPLTIAGGHLGVSELEGGSLIDFQHGSLKFTGATGLAISSTGPFGSTLNLASGSKLEVATDLTVADEALLVVEGGRVTATNFYNEGQLQLDGPTSEIHASSLTNTGLIIGEGRLLGGPLQNLLGGTVAVANDRQLRLSGTGNSNAGRIELANGRLQVDGDLFNHVTGDIVGRGTITVQQGLTNEGDLNFSSGVTDIFGEVTNQTTGRVSISGDAQVVFWDDVVHTGASFNVAGNSSVTFFGTAGFSVTGNSGKVYFEGNVAPGNSPGMGEFGGDVHFGSASELQIELAGTTKGVEYDSVAANGTAYLGGNLVVSLLDDYQPVAGDVFEILTAETIVGTFSSLLLPDLGSPLFMEAVYDAQSLSLLVVSPVVVLEGDYNGDGSVDGADYTVWRNTLGSSGEGLAADGDLNGTVDADDYVLWKSNFGKSSLAELNATAAVPEPSAIGLGLGLVTLLVAGGRSASRRAGE